MEVGGLVEVIPASGARRPIQMRVSSCKPESRGAWRTLTPTLRKLRSVRVIVDMVSWCGGSGPGSFNPGRW